MPKNDLDLKKKLETTVSIVSTIGNIAFQFVNGIHCKQVLE